MLRAHDVDCRNSGCSEGCLSQDILQASVIDECVLGGIALSLPFRDEAWSQDCD